jgi:hypothetical protein
MLYRGHTNPGFMCPLIRFPLDSRSPSFMAETSTVPIKVWGAPRALQALDVVKCLGRSGCRGVRVFGVRCIELWSNVARRCLHGRAAEKGTHSPLLCCRRCRASDHGGAFDSVVEDLLCAQELDELVRQAVRNIGYTNDDADTLTRYLGLLCTVLPSPPSPSQSQGKSSQVKSRQISNACAAGYGSLRWCRISAWHR